MDAASTAPKRYVLARSVADPDHDVRSAAGRRRNDEPGSRSEGLRPIEGRSTSRPMEIRPARSEDAAGILAIILPVIRGGETYALDPAMGEAAALAYWMGADRETFVAEEAGAIVGTYYLRANQAGGGAHVGNAGYMTAAAAAGRGIARAMCAHSLRHAVARGYRAMQFNFVVSTNRRAVQLWEAMGFAIVGRLPGAFAHPALGDVDALVMFRALPSPGQDVLQSA